MRISSPALTALGVLAASFVGCAHHKANQYTYAPPLAPPVYPQPQMASPTVAAVPMAPASTVGMPPAAPAIASAPMVGQPIAAAPGMADPCCMPMEGGGVPIVYESVDQTPACPPGP